MRIFFALMFSLLSPVIVCAAAAGPESSAPASPGASATQGEGEVNMPRRKTPARGLFDPAWTPLQLGLGRGTSLFGDETALRGIGIQLWEGSQKKSGAGVQAALAMLMNEGDFFGVNFSLWNVADRRMCGLQTGVLNYATDNCGVQAGLLNSAFRKNGLQIGLFNTARSGLQIGLFNSNQNSVLPFTIGINYSGERP